METHEPSLFLNETKANASPLAMYTACESDALTQALQRGIKLPPFRIPGLVSGKISRVRLDPLRHFNRLPARRIETRPVPRANARHQRAAKRSALFRSEYFHGLPVNPGLN